MWGVDPEMADLIRSVFTVYLTTGDLEAVQCAMPTDEVQ
jgi:hypothetical protein